jgi:hypothetical protein
VILLTDFTNAISGWLISYDAVFYLLHMILSPLLFVLQFRQVKSDIANASRVAYEFLTGLGQKEHDRAESRAVNQNRSSPRFQGNWFRNIVSAGAKPSTT